MRPYLWEEQYSADLGRLHRDFANQWANSLWFWQKKENNPKFVFHSTTAKRYFELSGKIEDCVDATKSSETCAIHIQKFWEFNEEVVRQMRFGI